MQSGNAFKAWQRLAQAHENKTPTEKHQIWQSMFAMRINNINEAQAKVAELQNMAAELRDLKEMVTDTCLMAMIISALPSEFKPFIANWGTQEDQSFSRFLKHLDQQIRQLILESSQSTENVAMAHQAFKGKKKWQKSANRGDRSGSSERSTQQASKKFEGTCNYCKKYGHMARECRKKKKDDEGKKNSGHQGQSSSLAETVFSFMAIAKFALPAGIDRGHWISDSGSSLHLSPNRNWFWEYSKLETPVKIRIGNSSEIKAIGVGKIKTNAGNIEQVYYVPSLWINLFSTSQVAAKGYAVTYEGGKVSISREGKTLLTGKETASGVYKLDLEVIPPVNPRISEGLSSEVAFVASSLEDWHKRLGHVAPDTVKKMLNQNIVDGLVVKDNVIKCSACAAGKAHKACHPSREGIQAHKPGEILHIDTVGPFSQPSLGGNRSFVLCKDKYSGFRMAKAIKTKTEIPEVVIFFINHARLCTGNETLAIHTDNGSEYVNAKVKAFCDEHGITHETSAPYTPQQNGYIERDIRTVTEMVRTMLLSAPWLSEKLWGEAVGTAVYTLNRLINSRSENATPYELWTGKRPNIGHLRIFGQPVAFMDLRKRHTKWEAKAIEGYFIGYTDRSNTYRILRSSMDEVVISCNVVFLNYEAPKLEEISTNGEENDLKYPIEVELDAREVNEQNVHQHRTAKRGRENEGVGRGRTRVIHLPHEERTQAREAEDFFEPTVYDTTHGEGPSDEDSRGSSEKSHFVNPDTEQGFNDSLLFPRARPYLNFTNEKSNIHPKPILRSGFKTFKNPGRSVRIVAPTTSPKLLVSSALHGWDEPHYVPHALISAANHEEDPKTYKAAMKRSDAAEWKAAMVEEINSIKKCKVWDLVDRPRDTNVVTSRWVLRLKRKQSGEVDRYRARLVARGFTQVEGIDYNETFSPVVNTTFIRVLLSYAARRNLLLAGFDIKTAFLNGDLQEVVYMEQPEGFVEDEKKVCKLNRSLYGLKQAPRCWNQKFTACLKELDITVSEHDACVMFRKNPLLIIAIYVDDGLILAQNESEINEVKDHLKRNFDIHEVGVDSFLGFQIDRLKDGSLFIHQTGYIEKVLKKFGMLDSSPVESPVVAKKDIISDDGPLDPKIPYREAIGSLTYAATITRADIAFAVNRAARKVTNPTVQDWQDIKRIFRYLRNTTDQGILYKRGFEDTLTVYVDADFAGCDTTARSTTGLVALLTGGPVHWRSKRQATVAKHSTEAELNGISLATEDVLWLRKLCLELDIIDTAPTRLLSDNQSAIRLGRNERVAERTRYMKVKAAFVREQIEEKLMTLTYVKGEDQLADIMTKPTLIKQFTNNRDRIMRSRSSLLSMILLTGVLLAASFVSAQRVFERTNPLIWTSMDSKVVLQEVKKIRIMWAQVNPCTVFRLQGDKMDIFTHNTARQADIEQMATEEQIDRAASTAIDWTDSRSQSDYETRKKLYQSCNDEWETNWKKRIEQLILPTDKSRRMTVLDQLKPKRVKRQLLTILAAGGVGAAVYGVVTSVYKTIKEWIWGSDDSKNDEYLKQVEESLRSISNSINETQNVIHELTGSVIDIESNILKLVRDIEELGNLMILAYRIGQLQSRLSRRIDQVLQYKSQGKIATWALADLTGVEELSEVDPEDTIFENASLKDGVVILDLILLVASKSTRVYRANTFKFYDNLDQAPVLKRYTGTDHAVYNESSNCLVQAELTSGRWIQQNCFEQDHYDEYAEEWEEIKNFTSFNEITPAYQHFSTLSHSYIYCFPGNITVWGIEHICPPNVFRLPIEVSYKTGRLSHDTSAKMINVTGIGKTVDRLGVGYFNENNYNYAQLKLVQNSAKLKALNTSLKTDIVIPKMHVYSSLGVGSFLLLGIICYLIYRVWGCIRTTKTTEVPAEEFQMQRRPSLISRTAPSEWSVATQPKNPDEAPTYRQAMKAAGYPQLDVELGSWTPEIKRLRV